MTESEVRKLFFIIQNTYSGFDGKDDYKVAIWVDLLQGLSFEQAQENLRKYILNAENKFPPHPGAIAETVTQKAAGPSIPNAVETRRMLDEWDRRNQLDGSAPPQRLREAVKSLEQLGTPSGPGSPGTTSDSGKL